MSKKHIKCCDELESQLKENYMFSEMSTSIFSSNPLPEPEIYVLSDGGHGGAERIYYCPFCGNKLNFKAY